MVGKSSQGELGRQERSLPSADNLHGPSPGRQRRVQVTAARDDHHLRLSRKRLCASLSFALASALAATRSRFSSFCRRLSALAEVASASLASASLR
jgi:hypothetical protein